MVISCRTANTQSLYVLMEKFKAAIMKITRYRAQNVFAFTSVGSYHMAPVRERAPWHKSCGPRSHSHSSKER